MFIILKSWATVSLTGLHVNILLVWYPKQTCWLFQVSCFNAILRAMHMWKQSHSICFSRSAQKNSIIFVLQEQPNSDEMAWMNFARTVISACRWQKSSVKGTADQTICSFTGRAFRLVAGTCISLPLSNLSQTVALCINKKLLWP